MDQSASTAHRATVTPMRASRHSCSACSLRAGCLPAGLDAGELERLDGAIESPAPLDRGETLIRAGRPCRRLYIVRSGALQSALCDYEGNEQVLGFHLPGEIVGVGGLETGRYRCAVAALERTSVCALPVDDAGELPAGSVALLHQFHRLVSREVRRHHRHIAALGRLAAHRRLACFLLDLSERYGVAGMAPDRFRLPMSRQAMASYLGLAVETVSRILAHLCGAGAIELNARRLVIRDPARLTAEAGQPVSSTSEAASA